MIEKTIFNNNFEIVKFIKNNYNLDINNVKKLDRGSANIYVLNNNEYILKEFQSKYSRDSIRKEISVINHLKKFNIKVPEYIKTINGKYDCVYKKKTIIVQKYICGNILQSNEGNYKQTIECADYYGRIVQALKTLPIKLPVSNLSDWYSNENFNISIKRHEELLNLLNDEDNFSNKIKEDILEKIDMINKIKNNDYSDMSKLTVLNTHGDYNVLQFIYKNGKINAVIDFVSSCRMPIVWEIIRSYSYIDKDAFNGEFNIDTFLEYVKTVNKYIKLNKYDIEYMPYLYLIQILNSTFGYKQYIYSNDIKLLNFAFFRTNLCRYLFNNSKLIVDRLNSVIN